MAVIAAMILGIASVAGSAHAQAAGRGGAPSPGAAHVISGQFIVELSLGVDLATFIGEQGFTPLFRYTIINGFAARMAQTVADRLAGDARVRAVSPDLVVHAFPKPPGSPGGGNGGGTGCTVTAAEMPVFDPEAQAGVRRIGAPAAWAQGKTGSGVKVAVIDTGIDLCHPDLKDGSQGGTNLVKKGALPLDDNGHGTHVAGIVAAAQNGFGVVGVAPGASLYAVKVLKADGSGSLSTVIKGLDWAVKNGMQVANLSLGALDLSLGSGPMCNAVSSAVASGVTVVSAAGNSQSETIFFTPANCVDSLTVSAFVDSDGLSGGSGPAVEVAPGVVERDDTFAETFSNYSNYCWDLNGDGLCTDADRFVIALTAPGADVLSTLPTYPVTLNGPEYGKQLNYDTLSGTSMAAPHVAGAAAVVIGARPGATPAQVRQALTAGGACAGGTTGGSITCPVPWPDDPDFAWEPLVAVGEL